MDVQYRHEWKHEIRYVDLLAIRQRLRAVAENDAHAVNGKYFIRSLYFDNLDDSYYPRRRHQFNLEGSTIRQYGQYVN